MTSPIRIGLEMISAGAGFAPAAGGITTYYNGLLGALAQASDDEIVVFMPRDAVGVDAPDRPTVSVVTCHGLPSGRVGRVAYEQMRLPALARGAAIDVLLSTHNVRPATWRGPSVVVLQSMQYFFLRDRIGAIRTAYLRVAVPRSLRGADVVIAVSETQRSTAIDLFGLDPARVVAVHHGPSPWAMEARRQFGSVQPTRPPGTSGRPYLLTVSALYGLKNHRRLIDGFARALAATPSDHELLIAGKDADVTAAELAARADQLGIGDRIRCLGAYPQEHLPALYANADAVAYVSLYETFGHPVLETFAFGRPLLTSSVGGTAEVAGDAAELADPTSVESIADGITRVLHDEQLRATLRERGTRRLADFSWEQSAEGHLRALHRAVSHRGANRFR